ncbi:interferon-induced protein 44-like [Ruditapes philippinarum]|uniref:interferon-induced protein 44-like n=1 Tax=Ruditapes philippinarum TaxID=129788 RepID=UPI00295B0F73|nr:interferon-induced protein 44-like [Ruditapes philippinarum]
MALGLYLGIGLTWKPWRQPYENFKWNKETAEKLQNDVYDIKPTAESGLKKFKALTIGMYGHGKSSLINSFASISVGEKTTVCNAADTEETVTTHYRNFVYPGTLGQFVLGDISGLPFKKDIHPLLEDMKLILQGHIKSGYKFNPEKRISSEDEYYESTPKFSDRIHCVMVVVDSTMACDLHASFVYGVKTIMQIIHSMNIPVIAVLTKTDKLSEHVKYSVESIFRCRKIQQAIERTSKQLEIPVPKIYPVVTFEEMDHFTWRESIPILIVMRSLFLMAKMHSHNADRAKE